MADYNLLNTHSFTPIARHFAERVGLWVPPTASQLFELVKTHLFSLSLYDPFLAPGFGYGHNAATYYHHGHPNQFAVPPQQFGGIRPDFPAPPHQQFGQPLPPFGGIRHGGIHQFAVPPRHFAERLNIPHNQQFRGIRPDFPVPPHQQQFGQPLPPFGGIRHGGIRQGDIRHGGIHQYFAVPPLPNQFGQAPPNPVGPIRQFAVPPLPNQFGQAPPNPVGPIHQFAVPPLPNQFG